MTSGRPTPLSRTVTFAAALVSACAGEDPGPGGGDSDLRFTPPQTVVSFRTGASYVATHSILNVTMRQDGTPAGATFELSALDAHDESDVWGIRSPVDVGVLLAGEPFVASLGTDPGLGVASRRVAGVTTVAASGTLSIAVERGHATGTVEASPGVLSATFESTVSVRCVVEGTYRGPDVPPPDDEILTTTQCAPLAGLR